jgi:multiple sugar transport system substrate-binding protein
MSKRNVLFLVVFLIGLIIVSSCSHNRQLNRNRVVTITLSGWSNLNEKQLLQEVLRDFEAKHPRIKVQYDAIADEYMDVLKTRLIGETAADVFYLEAFAAPEIMLPGVLEPLNSYITDNFNLADFYPQFLKAFQQDEKIYGLPKDYSTLALFYNKKAFRAVGLSQPPQTWTQLRKYAQKLTIDRNRDGRPEQYGFALVPELARQVFVIEAFGGELTNSKGEVTFAAPESLKGLQLLVDQYRLDRSAAQPSDVGTNSVGEMFGQEKVAMAIDGPWLIPYLQQTFPQVEYATAEVPTINDKKGTMAYTVAYVMNHKSKHKAVAWELISYLTGREGMKAWTSQGSVFPTRKSVTDALQYDKNPLYLPFIAGAEYATIWQLDKNLPIILNNFNNQFISAIIGKQSLASALQKAQKTADREIALSE